MNQVRIGQLLIAIFAMAWVGMAVSILIEGAADDQLSAMLAEPWPRPAYRIAGSVAILCAGPAMLVAIYNFFSTLAEVKPERRLLVQFIAPIAFFLPQLWTEQGNRHRKRFFVWIALFGVLFAFTAICFELVRG